MEFPNLPREPTTHELTQLVREMEPAQTLWASFLGFSESLAAELDAPIWAACQEICLKTFEDQKQLRLHHHLFLKNEVRQLRCESSKKLRFKGSNPHHKERLWGKVVAKGNWSGAYYCLPPKYWSVFRHGSV